MVKQAVIFYITCRKTLIQVQGMHTLMLSSPEQRGAIEECGANNYRWGLKNNEQLINAGRGGVAVNGGKG